MTDTATAHKVVTRVWLTADDMKARPRAPFDTDVRELAGEQLDAYMAEVTSDAEEWSVAFTVNVDGKRRAQYLPSAS